MSDQKISKIKHYNGSKVSVGKPIKGRTPLYYDGDDNQMVFATGYCTQKINGIIEVERCDRSRGSSRNQLILSDDGNHDNIFKTVRSLEADLVKHFPDIRSIVENEEESEDETEDETKESEDETKESDEGSVEVKLPRIVINFPVFQTLKPEYMDKEVSYSTWSKCPSKYFDSEEECAVFDGMGHRSTSIGDARKVYGVGCRARYALHFRIQSDWNSKKMESFHFLSIKCLQISID
jgi:hypothetical protein